MEVTAQFVEVNILIIYFVMVNVTYTAGTVCGGQHKFVEVNVTYYGG